MSENIDNNPRKTKIRRTTNSASSSNTILKNSIEPIVDINDENNNNTIKINNQKENKVVSKKKNKSNINPITIANDTNDIDNNSNNNNQSESETNNSNSSSLSLSSSSSIPPPARSLAEILERTKIKIIEKPDENNLTLEIKGVQPAFINSMRRAIMSNVSTIVFHNIFIIKNTGAMIDECLAVVLGLVDIQINPELLQPLPESFSIRYLEEGSRISGPLPKIDGFSDSILKFSLNVNCYWDKTLKKNVNEEINVEHLQWKPFGDQEQRFAPSFFKFVQPKGVITRLKPGQSLEIELWASKGVGETHSKYSPVSNCSFQLKNKVEISTPLPDTLDIENLAERLINICPQKVFGRLIPKAPVTVLDENNCDLCHECVNHPRLQKYVDVNIKRGHYWLVIESKGRISANTILLKAMEWLRNQNEMLAIEE